MSRAKAPPPKSGSKIVPPSSKTTGSSNSEHVIFCFTRLPQQVLRACAARERAEFLDRFEVLSKMTWAAVMAAPRTGLGCEKIPVAQLSGVPAVSGMPGIEFVLAFRAGSKRILAVREDAVLRVLHLDADLSAYDH